VSEKTKKSEPYGRANMVIVFHEGTGGKAVITRIVAKRRESPTKTSIRFYGPAVFSKNVAKHIKEVVYPVVDTVLDLLNIQGNGFDISVSNLGAASSNDVGIDIHGYSMDLSILVSMLSAATGAPVRKNIVFTGHIANTDGSVRMVSGIPEKAAAVINDPDTDTLIYPDIDGDLSMGELSPKEKERIEGALCQVKNRIRPIAVSDVGDLVKVAFTERDILVASLKKGFFKLHEREFKSDHPIEKAASHFTHGLEPNFWNQLYTDLTQGRSQDAHGLMAVFADFFIRNKAYPPKGGQNLFRVVASLPPETRQLKVRFPLLPMSRCIQLFRFAAESESEDVWMFLKACSGDRASEPSSSPQIGSMETTREMKEDQSLETIISEIDSDSLAHSITMKIDNARSSYSMDTVVVPSHEDFCDVIASYFTHLSRHMHGFSGPVDMDATGAESIEILEKAFANKGGFQAALAEARHATNGGMRYVLDVFTEQYKGEQIEKHVSRIFKLALDPLDWDRKVIFMESVIERLKDILPREIAIQPAEQFADHFEPIVRALVHSRDQLTSIFRTL